MNRSFKLITCLLLTGSYGAIAQSVSQGGFINGGFESGDFSSWTQGGGFWYGGWPIDPSRYLPGGSAYDSEGTVNTVVGPGPIMDPRTDGHLQIVYSGQKTAKVNDEHQNYSVSVISQTVSNYTAGHIFFAWAAVLEASHGPTDSDNFTLQLKDVTMGDTIYQVAYNSANAATANLFTKSSSNWFYTSWQVQDLDVTARSGHTFTLTLLASDCPYGGHAGYVYLDGFGAATPPTGPVLPTTGPLTLGGRTDLGTIILGNSISGGLSLSGGVPPYNWTKVGELPAGVTSAAGYLSGVPAQPGSYSVTLSATDATGKGISGALTFSVFGFTSNSLPQGIMFSPYLATAGIGGGTPPYSFTFTGLPAGLSGSTAGVIQGTVARAGTSNVLVTATDSTGVSVSSKLPLSFAIPAALSTSPSTLPGGMVGQVYSQVLSGAAGGAPPYSWSFVSGNLPDGLSLRPGGTIAGLPSRAGTFAFTVRATDVTGGSVVEAVSITIAPLSLSILAPALPSGMVGVQYPSQTIAILGGVPPYTFTPAAAGGVSLDSSGTISGTPSLAGPTSITVTAMDAAGTTGSATLAFTVRPFSTDLLLTAGSADFTLNAGTATLPSPQIVGIQSSAAATVIPYSVAITPASVNWLAVSPATGQTPGVMRVALNSQALSMPASATPYQATVTVACASPSPCAGNTQTIAVTLTVKNAPPQLSVQSDLISFSAAPGSGQALAQTLGLLNAGGGSIGIGSVTCAASWCGVSGIPGSISAGQTASLTVSVDPSSLTSGYYRTTINIKASTGNASLPVTLFIAGSPSLNLQPSGAQFQSLAGGAPNGSPPSFLVVASGNSPVSWTATVLEGASWLTLSSSSGSASASQPGQVNFSLNPGIVAGLKPQTYYGTIRVTAPGVVNSPQDFVVVLNAGPVDGAQRPTPFPAGLLFITQANATPPAQTVSVSTNSVSAIKVQVSASTDSGADWLSVTPNTGSAQPGTPWQTQVSVNPAKLSPGIYYGGVNYAFAGLSIRIVNVTLIVSAAPGTNLVSGLAPQLHPAATSCTPTLMAAAQTGLVNSFAQPTAWPVPIEVLLVNDCGDPVPNGKVVATFSNGDPPLPLNLSDSRSGLYAGTWTPRKTAQQTTITMRAAAPGFAAITTQLAGAVTPNAAPLLARNSTQHIFNPLAGGALAPGNLVQVSGTGLSSRNVTVPSGQLPTTLNGTQLVIGGVLAPLSSVSPGMVTAEIPFGLTPGMQYQVVLNANGAITTPDTIQLAGTSPGISTGTATLVNASHSDGSAVTEASPAAPGETLVMVAAGLGATDVLVADGAPSPATPAANAVSAPSLTIDGNPAVVSFAGLQPGMVGIYQVSFIVPQDAKSGDLTLVLSQDGQPGNAGVLPVKAKP